MDNRYTARQVNKYNPENYLKREHELDDDDHFEIPDQQDYYDRGEVRGKFNDSPIKRKNNKKQDDFPGFDCNMRFQINRDDDIPFDDEEDERPRRDHRNNHGRKKVVDP